MEIKGKKINFLGDSITFGCGASSPDKNFPSMMKKIYGLGEARNYGISGTRISRQARKSDWPGCDDYDHDFLSRVDEMDDDADIIVVFGGTNDFGHGDAPLGTFSDRSEYTFFGALHTLYTSLLNKYPSKDIVVLTPMHRPDEDNPRTNIRKAYDGAVLEDYVNAIKKVAAYYSLPVLDMYSCSGVQSKVEAVRKVFCLEDGVHPNDAGYERIANKVAAFLMSL